jgi:predicted nucleic acid-binding protein
MIRASSEPCLFETHALGYLARSEGKPARWFRRYAGFYPVFLAAATVTEQVRGYALLLERAGPDRYPAIEAARDAYLERLASGAAAVVPVTAAEALAAAQLAVLIPFSPNPPRRAPFLVESRQDRLARWRAQISIAATALATGMPLIHDSPADYAPATALVERFPERFPGIARPRFVWARRLGE